MNKVEAVARALCKADLCDPDQEYGGKIAWEDWADMAVAAISAIENFRPDPTIVYVEKGYSYYSDGTASKIMS